MRIQHAIHVLAALATAAAQRDPTGLRDCGFARYYQNEYTCYDGDFLCPIVSGKPTLRCGPDCYDPTVYSCRPCPGNPRTLQISDPPYENYFYSDCNSATQVIVTSPLPDSNLTVIGPRLIVAWPAGNSGACAFFAPENGGNGTLGISLRNSSVGNPLTAVYEAPANSEDPVVGVQGVIEFNSTAVLTIPILGSVRTIRDFTEGPSLLRPAIQDANSFSEVNDTVSISRLWLDNTTTTTLSFTAENDGSVTLENQTITFTAGQYRFSASYNYPQLKQLSQEEVLKDGAQGLIQQNPTDTEALSFLSYSEKLLAGAWRFLTYFGRDSMISALLLEPVLSQENGSTTEAVIGAVLERINRTDGYACHEETIGDYATYLNLENNITGTAPQWDYKMIDTDFFLPVLMKQYFVDSTIGPDRVDPFLSTNAGSINANNQGLTWGQLAQINAELIMNLSAPFATSPTRENLLRLKEGEVVGEWRDSTYGLGGGRIPYDVNTALVPAALRSIAALSRASNGTIFAQHPDWSTLADEYAQVWEDSTLAFFEVTVPAAEAISRIENFANTSNFYTGPANTANISSDYTYHAVALDGNNNLSTVEVMNTDDCFRHFLLNTTNQSQLTRFVNQTANLILQPFPAGLTTPIGLVVANPSLASSEAAPVLHANFTNAAYHGTVVWSWQLAMMARGLEFQLDRCSGGSSLPDFCGDQVVAGNARAAYNRLWDVIGDNSQYLSSEVWSFVYRDDEFVFTPLGSLPPPPGVGGSTESNVRQLWSLTFLAVGRNEGFR
ncbi:glycogen debranching enzyme [Elsinoe ampelina]|uniref:Glycogen debranching enzyme n=1 Tax=Elsinoe ampelina TaxID=302913 RepID=A0A6A6GA48_9PEZI|nr:glycogen debranching enzyme [Elsinoe ampelina]